MEVKYKLENNKIQNSFFLILSNTNTKDFELTYQAYLTYLDPIEIMNYVLEKLGSLALNLVVAFLHLHLRLITLYWKNSFVIGIKPT